jgi:group I intron endonuclease
MATIYSITSMKGNKVYIGSTTDFTSRKANHRNWNPTKSYCASQVLIQEYGFENCVFTVLEECVENQRYERERHWILQNPTHTNILIPARPIEEIKQGRRNAVKKYREAHIKDDEFRAKVNMCRMKSYHTHKDEINERRREKWNNNREEINRKRRESSKAKKQSNAL